MPSMLRSKWFPYFFPRTLETPLHIHLESRKSQQASPCKAVPPYIILLELSADSSTWASNIAPPTRLFWVQRTHCNLHYLVVFGSPHGHFYFELIFPVLELSTRPFILARLSSRGTTRYDLTSTSFSLPSGQEERWRAMTFFSLPR